MPADHSVISLQATGGSTGDDLLLGSSTNSNEQQVSGAAKDLLQIMEAPWANGPAFIRDLIGLAIIGCSMGVISWAYMKIVGDVTEAWLKATGKHDYPTDPKSLQIFSGSLFWIPICWAGGTLVGFLKVALKLDTYPSFLEDLLHQEVNPVVAGKVLVCCVASLLTGAALGPEAGLGATGGAVGTLVARFLCGGEPNEERRRLYTLAGMAAAFGSILPAPWVALLLVIELSNRKHDLAGKQKITMGNQNICLLGLVGSLAWVVNNLFASDEKPELPGSLFDLTYSKWMPLKALGLGLASVILVLVYFTIAGIAKRFFLCLSKFLERRCGQHTRIVALASLAGLLQGCLGFLVPLALLDGATQIMPTLKTSLQNRFGTGDLIGIAVAKCAAYWIAASGGLVGGIFFPLLYIGVVAGELMAKVPGYDTFPSVAFTVPVMMASIPAALLPMPFTMAALPLSTFNLGPEWCVPVFIAELTSYTLLTGSGLMRGILNRAVS